MQAARGTSVGADASSGVTRRRARVLFITIAVLAYAIDQASKAVAVAQLEGRADIQVLGDLLQLNLIRNPGAAFSLGVGLTPYLSALAVVAALVVLWFARRLGSVAWAVALGLLFAGVTGNLTDRIVREPGVFHGHVIDFLELPNWPVFNVADICINLAAALIIVQAFRGIRLDGTRESDDEAPALDDPTNQSNNDLEVDSE